MMTMASIASTIGSGARVRSRRPTGMPAKVARTRRTALFHHTCCQSCATTIAATVMDTSAAIGAATVTGITSASSGTATSASPNPNAERTNVPANRMTATSTEYRKISHLSETRVTPIALRQHRSGHWPHNRDIWIVPRDADLARCIVDVRALVFDLRHAARDGKAVRESLRDIALLEVFSRQ